MHGKIHYKNGKARIIIVEDDEMVVEHLQKFWKEDDTIPIDIRLRAEPSFGSKMLIEYQISITGQKLIKSK